MTDPTAEEAGARERDRLRRLARAIRQAKRDVELLAGLAPEAVVMSGTAAEVRVIWQDGRQQTFRHERLAAAAARRRRGGTRKVTNLAALRRRASRETAAAREAQARLGGHRRRDPGALARLRAVTTAQAALARAEASARGA